MAGLTAAEAAVLLAVASGARTVEEVAELLNISPTDASRIIERLVAGGYLVWRERRRLLFLRRRELALTEKGLEALPEARRLLEHAARIVEKTVAAGGEAGPPPAVASTLGAELALLIPMLVGLGFLDAALLSTLTASRYWDELSVDTGGEEEFVEADTDDISSEDFEPDSGMDAGVDAGGDVF